jgi:hypothetical protein
MNMPGFAAEVSVYPTNTRYRSAASYAGRNQSPPILPATACSSCFCDVFDFGPPGTCAKLCVDGPGGAEYPVFCRADECNPPCDQPTCGPCTQTCTYPSGSSLTQSC